MRLFYSPEYVLATTDFDTTRKAAWVAASLAERPIPGVEIVPPVPLSEDAIAAVHDLAYVRAVRTGEPRSRAASNGLGWDAGLFPMVAASNGGAVAAALDALSGGRVAGSLSSGLHHARKDRGAGYCTFNGLALAARAGQQAGAGRILIVDLDAHCGGGTHELLGHDAAIEQVDVAVASFDRYAGSERWTLDLVHDADDYLPTIRRRLDAVGAADATFDLVLYNAGMDPHERSAVGGLPGVTASILEERERLVFDWARSRSLPVAFVLAGGYARGDAGRAELVDLHRLTIAAAARGA